MQNVVSHTATDTENYTVNEGVNLHEEVHYEENTADRTACKKGETDNLLKAELLTEEGHANHCKNHEGSGENGRDSLICNVIVNRRIHIHRDILGEWKTDSIP